jgi:hypothetical protein
MRDWMAMQGVAMPVSYTLNIMILIFVIIFCLVPAPLPYPRQAGYPALLNLKAHGATLL